MEKKEWFAEWFDTKYYHILYKDRDHQEAERFIKNLCNFLQLEKDKKVLDLACGKGRHALMLNKLGYSVQGADLSPSSIQEANKFANEHLHFVVHDMREIIPNTQFGCIFNLFTSFGYFDSMEDNLKVLNSVHEMLTQNGLLIIDFMNAEKVISNLVKEEIKQIEGISFNIERRYDGTHIYKDIRFVDEGHDFHFTERVQGLKEEDFRILLDKAGFNILHTFGDFDLNRYDNSSSDRLIIIAVRR